MVGKRVQFDEQTWEAIVAPAGERIRPFSS
jgi:hypothetical protein